MWLEARVNITTLATSFEAKPLISYNVVIPSETIAVPESKFFKPMSVCGFSPGNRENVMIVRGKILFNVSIAEFRLWRDSSSILCL